MSPNTSAARHSINFDSMRFEKKRLYFFVLNFFLYNLRLCPYNTSLNQLNVHLMFLTKLTMYGSGMYGVGRGVVHI